MELPQSYRLNRGVLEVTKLSDGQSDRQYWMSKTPEERFEALELIRQVVYGYDPATARLQRVFEVAKLERR